MDEEQELLRELRQRKQVAQEAFMDAQRTFLEAQHAYVDASQAMKPSADLKDFAAAVLAAAEPYLAALETLRNTQMQAEPSQERDVEDEQLEKLRQALERQVETFRQALLHHS
jgi:hypothetical protein